MNDRIRLIDSLRGLSLAGIAITHFGEQYLGFMPPRFRSGLLGPGSLPSVSGRSSGPGGR
jgi:peptidoglycan/LPS O-acetylase OafA/YrhL